jgi:flavin-dependent dehydrogenase
MSYTVLRARFDQWFAEKVMEMPELKEGATILAVKLAALLDLAIKNPERLNFKKNWVEAEAVV